MTAQTGKGHTPGPWIYANLYNEYRLADPRNVALGIVGGIDALTHEEDAANARLIAAAPALLEALRALQDGWDDYREEGGQQFIALMDAAAEQARAAIRLAQGEG